MSADGVPPTGADPAVPGRGRSRGRVQGQGQAQGGSANELGLMGLNLKYFALRAAMFGSVLAVLLVLGLDGILGFALALVVSGLLSYPLALRQRRAILNNVVARRGGGAQ